MWEVSPKAACPQSPGLHYLPAAGPAPGAGEGLYVEGRGSPDSGTATSDQAGKGTAGTQHLLGALYQPAVQPGVSCAHLPHAALAQIFCQPPSNLRMEEGPWGQPQAQK